jgi:hypothetical protein
MHLMRIGCQVAVVRLLPPGTAARRSAPVLGCSNEPKGLSTSRVSGILTELTHLTWEEIFYIAADRLEKKWNRVNLKYR